jgi:protein TonB
LSGRKRLWAGGGAALALLAGAIVALWAANRRPGPEAPAMDSAPAATAAEAPLLARAEKALVEERLDEAATALEAAGQAGADGGRIAVLTAQLQKSRQRVATVPRSASAAAPVAGTGASASATATATASSSSSASSSGADGTSIGSGVGAADERLTQVLSLAEARLKEGRLIEPDGDNALFYVQQARRLDPDGNAAQAARQTLALALLTAVRTAVDHRDWARAASLVDAAGGIAAESNVENARQYLRTARERADAPALPDPMPPAPAPAPATATAPATAPTRQDEPVAAAQVAAAPLATARVAAAHVEPARAEPAAIVAAGQLTLLKSTRPVYPTDAATAGTEGWVELDFTVAPDGAVKDIAVHGANPRGVFENAAIRALAQWRYQPVLEDAQPVAQRARIRIRFALQN